MVIVWASLAASGSDGWAPTRPETATLTVFQALDGTTLERGDTVTLGEPTGTATRPNRRRVLRYYVRVVNGPGDHAVRAPASWAGQELEILWIWVGGTESSPAVLAEASCARARTRANRTGLVTITDLGEALRSGELVAPARPEL